VFFGYDWLSLSGLKQWSTEISVALVGVAYMFGLIFDKAVGALPYSWAIGGSALTPVGDLPSPMIMRMEILTKKPEVYEVIERRINQHRLVRATVFNLALISLSALIFIVAQLGLTIRRLVVFVFPSVVFIGLALFTGRRSAKMLYFELFHAYKTINPNGPVAPDQDDPELNT